MTPLSKMEARLPPGFRFYPRDEELISDYLAGKVSGDGTGFPAMMIDVDLNKCEPWALPESACVGGKEWYFYSLPDRKYSCGRKTNRATFSGYWKATGKDRPVFDPRGRGLVGTRKTLVFYHGRAPNGRKTNWVMHEFRLDGSAATSTTAAATTTTSSASSSKGDWVLCRVVYRSRGPAWSEARKGSSHDEPGPSPLPPSMDTVGLLEQAAELSLEDYCQPAPCTSSHPPGHYPTQWLGASATTHVSPAEGNMPKMMAKTLAHPGELMAPGWGSNLKSLSYDSRAAIFLDQLHKLHGNPRLEGSSSGGQYLK